MKHTPSLRELAAAIAVSALLALCVVRALAQSPALTTVTDNLYGASGTVTVVADQTFTTADGYVIPKGYEVTATVTIGTLSVQLPPNLGSLPTGTYYTAYYNVTPGGKFSETWVVPASGTPVKLATVRSLSPPVPTLMISTSQIMPPGGCALNFLQINSTNTGFDCSATTGGGSVTSVALGAPAWFTVTGSPITGAGTLTFAAATGQPSHEVLGTFAGTSVGLGPLSAADLPGTISSSTTGNAATATALATTPAQCPSTQIVTGVQANGDANCQDPLVSGPTAIGSAPGVNNPVFVAGWDGTDIRAINTDTSGRPNVNVNGNVAVTGTFWQTTQPVSLASLPALPTGGNTVGAVNQAGTWNVGITGTPAFALSGNASVVGTASDNTADSTAKLPVLAAVANSAAPTYTAGNQVPLSTDTGGNLRTVCSNCSGGSGGTAQSDAGSFTQGSSSFTPVGGEYNSSPTSLSSGQAGAALMTATRHLDVAVADALPAGGNTIGAVTAAGTFPVSGTVNANIGTTNGLALDATVSSLQVAQGSTTAGQKGSLLQGAVTTAAPAYTTAQTSPISLTTAGAVRVDASATTQPVSGTVGVNNFPATQAVSGTVTANEGGAPWTSAPQPTSASAQATTSFTSNSVTSAATVDSAAGNLFSYEATSSGTAACYVEFFNAASGSVTLGTTAPVWVVPLLSTASNGYSRNNAPTAGALFSFGTALSVAAVTTPGGSTTCPANSVLVNVGYK